MSDYIPEEIITKILLRLPVKSLIRFTRVCKSWRSIITSPGFASEHISISKNSENPSKTLLLRRYNDRHRNGEAYSLLKLEGNNPSNVVSCTVLKFPFQSEFAYFRVVGSYHGLVCLSDDLFACTSTPVILWNPLVRNHVMLPKVLCKPEEPHYSALGFGSSADDYKVVRLVYRRRNDGFSSSGILGVEIYSLNVGEWRVLSGADVRLRVPDSIWFQVFSNGFVHWLAYDWPDDGSLGCSILTFDLSNEVFGELTLPSELMNEQAMSNLSISAFRTSLAVIKYDREKYGSSCNVWMMNDYRSNEPWSKLYKIDLGSRAVMEKVIAFRGSSEALLALYVNEMSLYDLESKRIKRLGIYGTIRSFYAEDYMESMLLFGRRNEVIERRIEGATATQDRVNTSS